MSSDEGSPLATHVWVPVRLLPNLRRRNVGPDFVRGCALGALCTYRFGHIKVRLSRLYRAVDIAGSRDRFEIELDYA